MPPPLLLPPPASCRLSAARIEATRWAASSKVLPLVPLPSLSSLLFPLLSFCHNCYGGGVSTSQPRSSLAVLGDMDSRACLPVFTV